MSAEKATIISADFGIESLLSKNSKILYDSVYSTRHIGRVIDFFLYENQLFYKDNTNSVEIEHKMRSVLELSTFNAWRNYRSNETVKCVDFEVGADQDKLIISITSSFNSELVGIDISNTQLQESTLTEEVNRIRFFHKVLNENSDKMIVRYNKVAGRMQCVYFFYKNNSSLNKEKKYQFFEVSPETLMPAKEINNSQQEHLATANVDAFNKDAINSQKSTMPNLSLVANLETNKPVDLNGVDWLAHVQGQGQSVDNDEIRIKGVTENRKDEKLKISGGSDQSQDDTKVFKSDTGLISLDDELNLGADNNAADTSKTVISTRENASDVQLGSQIEQDLEKIAKEVIVDLRHELGSVDSNIVQEQYSEIFNKASAIIFEKYLSEVKHILKIKGLDQDNNIVISGVSSEDLDKKLDEVIIGYSKKIDNLSNGADAKELVKEMFAELQKEKGEFNKKVREYESDQKKRELAFKTLETTLKEQLRRKDEALKQKDLSLEKAKESLTNALGTIGRLKSEGTNSDQAETLKKLMVAEKMLAVTKESNDKNAKRLEEVQAKWMKESSERAALAKELAMKQKQIGDLQNRLNNALSNKEADRAAEANQKVIDGFKLQIKQLQEKVQIANAAAAKATQQAAQDSKKVVNKADDNEFKHKYDQASKLLKATKEDNEKLKKKADDLRLSETQLKVEIGKLQAQIKSLLKK